VKVAEEIPYMYSILSIENYPWKSVTGDMAFDAYVERRTRGRVNEKMGGLPHAVHVSITREFYANGN